MKRNEIDIDHFSRMEDHLAGISDPVLLILKGHLLIEEALRSAIARNVKCPDALTSAKLSFYQLLNISRAMFGESTPTSEKLWDAFFALNSLRNELAHRLDHKATSPLLRRIFIISAVKPRSIYDKQMVLPIQHSLGFLIGAAAMMGCSKANSVTSDTNLACGRRN